jgi:hypothetical protein
MTLSPGRTRGCSSLSVRPKSPAAHWTFALRLEAVAGETEHPWRYAAVRLPLTSRTASARVGSAPSRAAAGARPSRQRTEEGTIRRRETRQRLQPGEEIGREVYTTLDQFFRIEPGEATFALNEHETRTRAQDQGRSRGRGSGGAAYLAECAGYPMTAAGEPAIASAERRPAAPTVTLTTCGLPR